MADNETTGAPQAKSESPPEETRTSRYIPLAFSEGRLLEVLSFKLGNYMHRADIQTVLCELRDELYSKIEEDSLKNVHAVSQNCHRCEDIKSTADLPRWNLVDPDCLFVAESPNCFSQEVAGFLVKTLSEVGFSSRHVCLTYLNRCQVFGRKYSAEESYNCKPYLYTEIEILKPKLIVLFGSIVNSAVLKSEIELESDRGKVLWVGPWPVMCMWSPTYPFRSGESKSDQFRRDIETAYNFVYGREKEHE